MRAVALTMQVAMSPNEPMAMLVRRGPGAQQRSGR